MKDEDTILLDDYFNDRLTQEGRLAVQERTRSDAEFAEEFALRQQMAEWPLRQKRRQLLVGTLESAGAEYFADSASEKPARGMVAQVNWRRWMLAAASVAVLAIALWFVSSPEPVNYRQYAQYAPLALTERGAAVSTAASAESAFNTGRYAEALAALDQILTEQPENSVARLYRAMCLLEMNRPSEARAALAPIAGGQSALRADALWYIALSYLLENNPAACRQALENLSPGDDHYDKSRELLQKLK